MNELTSDEFTVLLLAEKGESMIPIGRWKEPILSLAGKGLLQKNDEVNYAITLAGREACAERNRADEGDLSKLLGGLHAINKTQTSARQHVEQAAQHLAAAAKESAVVTGDTPTHALREWSKAALTRALELLSA